MRLIEADMGEASLATNHLHMYDLKTKSWTTNTAPLPSPEFDGKFNVASCQFAIHYMFQTRQRASRLMMEISRLLAPGGVFIVSTMDCRVVEDMALAHISGSENSDMNHKDVTRSKSNQQKEKEFSLQITSEIEVGDGGGLQVQGEGEKEKGVLMEMEFTQEMWNRLIQKDSNRQSELSDNRNDEDSFGIRYNFTLLDAPRLFGAKGDSAVEAPEWLVPLGKPLENLAAEYDLKIELVQNFQEFVVENMKNLALRCVIHCAVL